MSLSRPGMPIARRDSRTGTEPRSSFRPAAAPRTAGIRLPTKPALVMSEATLPRQLFVSGVDLPHLVRSVRYHARTRFALERLRDIRRAAYQAELPPCSDELDQTGDLRPHAPFVEFVIRIVTPRLGYGHPVDRALRRFIEVESDYFHSRQRYERISPKAACQQA